MFHTSSPQGVLAAFNGVRPNSGGTKNLRSTLTIYATIEFLSVAGSAYLIELFYYAFFLKSWEVHSKDALAAVVIATLFVLSSIALRSLTGIRRRARHIFLLNGLSSVALAFSMFLSILFITKLSDDYSRATFVLQIFGVGLIISCLRTLFYSWLHLAIASNKIEARRVILFGDMSQCVIFANRLKESGIKVVGFFHLPKTRNLKHSKIREIIAECRSLRADDIIVLTNHEFLSGMFELASYLAELPYSIHIVPIDALNVFASSQISELGNLQTIRLYAPPLSTSDLFIKRVFDFVFATIALLVLSPLFLAVSVAIKLDTPGPAFFRQKRHGFNNEEIHVFKFRSMTLVEDGDKFTQATSNDTRVTRVGNIIRRTNIDELPQLINVLRGDMSIVGPRPHPTALNALYNNLITPFSRRHNVKPGITGWAQVNGFRGPTDTLEKMQRRIEYDLHYIDHWSLLFDVKIILMTLFSKSAYMNAY